MQTNLAVEQNKNIKWSLSPWNQSGRKVKGLLSAWLTAVECAKFEAL